jgi:hypothetical protein
MMTKFFRFLKRIIWVSLFGTMIALHNFYQKEFHAVEDVKQEVVEEEE